MNRMWGTMEKDIKKFIVIDIDAFGKEEDNLFIHTTIELYRSNDILTRDPDDPDDVANKYSHHLSSRKIFSINPYSLYIKNSLLLDYIMSNGADKLQEANYSDITNTSTLYAEVISYIEGIQNEDEDRDQLITIFKGNLLTSRKDEVDLLRIFLTDKCIIFDDMTSQYLPINIE